LRIFATAAALLVGQRSIKDILPPCALLQCIDSRFTITIHGSPITDAFHCGRVEHRWGVERGPRPNIDHASHANGAVRGAKVKRFQPA